MANVITTLLKMDSTQFKTGMKGAQQSIKETDGLVNKAKAGWSSLLSGFASSPLAITAAVGAVTALGTAAVKSFQEGALEAGKFADATGLTTEAASRLLEVSGDIGVSAGTVESAVARMNQAIGQGGPLIDELGLALQRTSDGSADVNATLLDTIDRINRIQDPTKRAAAAAKVFGRGYKEAAELIGLSADELRAKLEDVGDAQVFDDEDRDRARELREEMDNVQDSAARVSRAFGETLVPILADAAATVNNLIDSYDRLKAKIPDSASGGPVGSLVGGLVNPTQALSGALDGLNRATSRLDQMLGAEAPGVQAITDAVQGAIDPTHELARAAEDAGNRWAGMTVPLEAASGAFAELGDRIPQTIDEVEDGTPSIAAMASAFADLRQKVDFLSEAMDGVRGRLDMADLLDDITEQFGKIAEAEDELGEDRAIRDLQRQLLRLLDSIDSIPASKKVQFAAEIERGGVDELYRILGELTKGITIPARIDVQKTPGFTSLNGVFAPGVAPTPIFNGVTAPTKSAPTGSSTTYNYFPTGTSPTIVAVDGRTYEQRNQFDRTAIR